MKSDQVVGGARSSATFRNSGVTKNEASRNESYCYGNAERIFRWKIADAAPFEQYKGRKSSDGLKGGSSLDNYRADVPMPVYVAMYQMFPNESFTLAVRSWKGRSDGLASEIAPAPIARS